MDAFVDAFVCEPNVEVDPENVDALARMATLVADVRGDEDGGRAYYAMARAGHPEHDWVVANAARFGGAAGTPAPGPEE